MTLQLINGAALLLALCWLQSINLQLWKDRKILEKIFSGLLFGIICIIGMTTPVTLLPGIIFDARSVVLGMAGLFGGPVVALIAALIAASYRLWLGGTGTVIGISVIFVSILLGLGFRFCRQRKWIRLGVLPFLAFGLLLHSTVILIFAQFPHGIWQSVMQKVALPFLTIFSVATAFLGLLLQDIEYRQKMKQALQRSEARLRATVNALPDLLLVIDEEGRYLEILSASTDLLHKKPAELIGQRMQDAAPAEQAERFLALIRKTLDSQATQMIEYELQTLTGKRQFEGRVQPIAARISKQRTVVFVARDITERVQHRARETRLTNIQRALSEINDAILRLDDPSALFPLVCKMAVDYGGIKVAWIVIADASGDQLRPIVSAGAETSYLDHISISTSPDLPEGQGTVNLAYLEKRNVVTNDFSADACMAPWSERALQYGIRSGASFPILRGGNPYAVFVVNSGEIGAFDDETVGLLDQIAKNTSFALDNFDRETLRLQGEAALRESERRFRRIAEQAPFPMQIHAEDGEILMINQAWTDITGYTRSDIPTIRDWAEKSTGDQAMLTQENIRQLFGSTRRVSGEYLIRCKDGSERICYFNSSPLDQLPDGRRAMISMAVDVTDRRRTEKALQLTQFSVNHAAFPIFWIAPDALILFANEAACRMLDYDLNTLLQHRIFDFGPDYSVTAWNTHWHKLLQEKSLHFETRMISRTGQLLSVEVNANHLEYEGQEYNCAFIRDITDKKKTDELIWRQANFDPLTGLPNRRMFADRLGREIRTAHRSGLPLALLFLDIDHFKNVNDTLGHTLGDLLLKQAAQRLATCVRETDTIARLGGDEFTVILSDLTDITSIERVVSHILQQLAAPFQLEHDIAYVSVSIGITLYPDDAGDVENLLKNADRAMYAAKQQGRNRHYYFTPSMQEAAQHRMQLVRDLHGALEGGQFRVAYQPIIELTTGSIHKAEALIRWHHPERGIVSPAEFIPTAEETGMIHDIGAWIFRQAAQQADVWRQTHHPDFQISVNMSPVQFRSDDKNRLAWAEHLAQQNLQGASITIEITEGLLLDASPEVTSQLIAFRDAGIEVAIDDFGTGYSSLSYLKKFDIDYIKIDRAFITGLAPGAEDLALCEAIIVMAHRLGIKVIAEGVETREQHQLLAAAGCDYAQGYLFSRPLPASDLAQLLRASSNDAPDILVQSSGAGAP